MPKILLDAHVHLHPGAARIAILMEARRRMAAIAGSECLPVVLLAEQQGCHEFEALRKSATATQENESLWLGTSTAPLLIIAGRQVVTNEGLEILAQGTCAQFPDGLPADELLEAMLAIEAIITLPWGVGKWLGRRGRLVDRLLAADQAGRLLLGDNGGRPGWWPERRLGARRVLRGSDPLPIKGDMVRIGSFGSMLDGGLSRERPAADLRALLRTTHVRPDGFGAHASSLRFLSNQLRLRVAA